MEIHEEAHRRLHTMVLNAPLTITAHPHDAEQVVVYATFSCTELEDQTGLTLPGA